ncbi:MAG TPA: sialidase family protein [Armatimonadota bacterium]|nr:sialidase family protein [Armatimonadota bacterium]
MRENTAVGLTLGAPVVIARATPEVTGWGPYQFPRVERLADGALHVAYHVRADSATAYGLSSGHAVSHDEGRSWQAVDTPSSPGGLLLPNGDRLLADAEPSRPVGELSLPAPFASVHGSYVDYDYYRLGHLPAELAPAFPFRRCPAGETTWRREWATVELDNAGDVRTVTEGVFVFPFFEQDRVRVASDGSLRATTYFPPHLGHRDKVIRAFLVRAVRSDDFGHTWRQIGAIPYHPDPAADPLWDARDGFTEPELHDMPDGAVLALLRTMEGNGNGPLYCARSEDGGATWDTPRVFDDLGVWPQLLTLGCGVTLAAYGRPGLFVRATADPAGRQWDDRVTVVPPRAAYTDTCSYADLIALDDTRALLVYSDFTYPNIQGQPCKTIVCREVGVE